MLNSFREQHHKTRPLFKQTWQTWNYDVKQQAFKLWLYKVVSSHRLAFNVIAAIPSGGRSSGKKGKCTYLNLTKRPELKARHGYNSPHTVGLYAK